ncbi:MAG: cytochrome c biogenesis protein CcdA [Candidatus Omnitrophota bacterium]|jgi:thiol:disulfide interchange protein DsbD
MNLSGTPFDFVIAFAGGVVWSFTPCVYPLLPVIIGYVGASSCASHGRAFCLSFSYASGTAFVYALLGVLASLGGRAMGSITASPLTGIISGLVILGFGFSMSGALKLPVMAVFRIRPAGKAHSSIFWAFLLGCSSALLISPCVTPVLGSILVYLASRRNVAYGAVLLLTFAYGMGLIFVLAGTSGHILSRLPKSGKWLEWINKGCALLLCVIGVYFIVRGLTR